MCLEICCQGMFFYSFFCVGGGRVTGIFFAAFQTAKMFREPREHFNEAPMRQRNFDERRRHNVGWKHMEPHIIVGQMNKL